MSKAVISIVTVIGVACAFLGFSRTATSSVKSAPNLAAPVLDARVEALRKNDSDPNSQEVERRLAALYRNSSKEADEAIVILMSFYLGEHQGEELYENLLSRGPRMIPIIVRYLRGEPASILKRYPKSVRLERKTTVTYLKEALQIFRVQAGAKRVSGTTVETAPLQEQSRKCTLKLVRRPKLNFGDDLIQPGESYHATPVLRVNIEETGDMTNVELMQSSGIKRLDTLLMTNVRQWKYEPRPGCGVIESNISITIDWR